jgi:hypothetical protein
MTAETIVRVRRAASGIRSEAGLFVDKPPVRFFNWAEDGLLRSRRSEKGMR